MYHQDSWRAVNARYRCDVAGETKIEIVVERHVPGIVGTDHEQRVAVGGRLDRCFDGEVATSAGPVLNYELLAEALRQPLADQAGIQVDHAASRKAGDQAHWPRWIGLRHRNTRHRRQRGSARCEMEKISAGKFHFKPPFHPHHSITSSARASSGSAVATPSVLARWRPALLRVGAQLVGRWTGHPS